MLRWSTNCQQRTPAQRQVHLTGPPVGLSRDLLIRLRNPKHRELFLSGLCLAAAEAT